MRAAAGVKSRPRLSGYRRRARLLDPELENCAATGRPGGKKKTRPANGADRVRNLACGPSFYHRRSCRADCGVVFAWANIAVPAWTRML